VLQDDGEDVILDDDDVVDLNELLELLDFDLELEVFEDMEALEVELDLKDTVDLEELVVALRVEELPDRLLLELDALTDDFKLGILVDEDFTVVLSKVVGVDFETLVQRLAAKAPVSVVVAATVFVVRYTVEVLVAR